MRGLVLVLVLSLLPHGSLEGQTTPEAAALAFGAAIRRADYPTAARLMHPSALRKLRTLFTPLVSAPEGGEMTGQLFGMTSLEFAKASDTVMFSRFLKTVMAQQEGLGEALRTAKIDVLGHVTTPGDTNLVVTRTTISVEGVAISTFEVMPFILDRGKYWALLKSDFTNMASMMQARLGKRT